MSNQLVLDANPYPHIVFVDCEASALDRPSYPIEVGLGTCDGVAVSHLIRPAPEWESWIWSEKSALIHNIPRQSLYTHGKDVTWVANFLNEQLDGKTVCSDAPRFDAYWLSAVFRAAGVTPRFAFRDSSDEVFSVIEDLPNSEVVFEQIRSRVAKEYPVTHRAADDALFWAMFYRAAQDCATEHRRKSEKTLEEPVREQPGTAGAWRQQALRER